MILLQLRDSINVRIRYQSRGTMVPTVTNVVRNGNGRLKLIRDIDP